MGDAKIWDCTESEYFADRTHITRSMVMDFRKSRAYYHARYVTAEIPPPEPTPALQFGTWGHLAILQPGKWSSDVVAMPKFDRRTKAGKAEHAAFMEEHEGKILVPAEDHATIERMRDRVYENPMLRLVLDGCTDREQCVAWTCPQTGQRLKARRDARRRGRVIDLKIVHDAAPYPFMRAIVNYSWYIQAAMYADSEVALTGEHDAEFYFLVVHKEPPHEAAIYGLGIVGGTEDDGVEMGRQEYRRTLREIAECDASGDWRNPWEKKAQLIELPSWVGNESEWR